MTKFIRVNESMTHGDTKLLLLNADYITHVQQGLNGKDTHIRMHDFKTYYFVKESVQEVWDQIMTDNTKPPVLMSASEYAKFEEMDRRKTNGMG